MSGELEDLEADYCGFGSEETERSESTDNLNKTRPKAVGKSGHANLRGYLWRLGGGTSIFSRNHWKKRWCVLDDGKFSYYASREEWSKLVADATKKGKQDVKKPPYELINCDVVPAEAEEGDEPSSEEEWEEEEVDYGPPLPLGADGGADAESAHAAESTAATQSHAPWTPDRKQRGTGNGAAVTTPHDKNVAQRLMRRRQSEASGQSGTLSISFANNSPPEHVRNVSLSLPGSPGYPMTPSASPGAPTGFFHTSNTPTPTRTPTTPGDSGGAGGGSGGYRKKKLGGSGSGGGKAFGSGSSLGSAGAGGGGLGSARSGKKSKKSKRKKVPALPPDTFGFLIEARDSRPGHRLRAPDQEQRGVWMERLILAANRNAGRAAKAAAAAAAGGGAGASASAVAHAEEEALDRFKVSSKRRSMTVAMAAEAKRKAATLPRWGYLVDRRNMAELLWLGQSQARLRAKDSATAAAAAAATDGAVAAAGASQQQEEEQEQESSGRRKEVKLRIQQRRKKRADSLPSDQLATGTAVAAGAAVATGMPGAAGSGKKGKRTKGKGGANPKKKTTQKKTKSKGSNKTTGKQQQQQQQRENGSGGGGGGGSGAKGGGRRKKAKGGTGRRGSRGSTPPPARRNVPSPAPALPAGGGGAAAATEDNGGPALRSPRRSGGHERASSDTVCFIPDLAVDPSVVMDAGGGGGGDRDGPPATLSPRRRSISTSPRGHAARARRRGSGGGGSGGGGGGGGRDTAVRVSLASRSPGPRGSGRTGTPGSSGGGGGPRARARSRTGSDLGSSSSSSLAAAAASSSAASGTPAPGSAGRHGRRGSGSKPPPRRASGGGGRRGEGLTVVVDDEDVEPPGTPPSLRKLRALKERLRPSPRPASARVSETHAQQGSAKALFRYIDSKGGDGGGHEPEDFDTIIAELKAHKHPAGVANATTRPPLSPGTTTAGASTTAISAGNDRNDDGGDDDDDDDDVDDDDNDDNDDDDDDDETFTDTGSSSSARSSFSGTESVVSAVDLVQQAVSFSQALGVPSSDDDDGSSRDGGVAVAVHGSGTGDAEGEGEGATVDPFCAALQSEAVRVRIAQMLLPKGVRHQLWGCAKLQRHTCGDRWIHRWPTQDSRLPPPRKGPRPSLLGVSDSYETSEGGADASRGESPIGGMSTAEAAMAMVEFAAAGVVLLPPEEYKEEDLHDPQPVVVVAEMPDPAGWYGVLETDKHGRLMSLDLSRNRLRGSLPYDGLGRLVELRELRMRGNDLLGRIPRDLGALVNLTHLDLSRNRLAGFIPGPPLKRLVSLQMLDLSYNQLTGPVPVVELAELRHLGVVQLQGNQLLDADEAKALLEVAMMHVEGCRVRV